MIQTGFESKVKVQDLIESQLPSFILDENPNATEFLKQYYISQEYQGGPVDLADNLDQYLKVDNLTPEVVVDSTTTTLPVLDSDTTINVSSTKGFPNSYGILKIDSEIITYTGITTNTFTGCIRGFSGITSFHQDLNQEELIFSTSTAASHNSNAPVQNLSSLFLKEFYKQLKYTFTPGFEELTFAEEINAGSFIKRAKDFYESKGTDESIKILFKVLFGETPDIINLEEYIIKPSSANYVRRQIVLAEAIVGNPQNLIGQTLIKSDDSETSASISSVEPVYKNEKTFYRLELFIGSNEQETIFGNFEITSNTKSLETVSIGSSVISVDSTIGFPESGTIISGTNSITYSNKTINQFLNCNGIETEIKSSDNVRSTNTYFSYENADTSKKVELILYGVIDNIKQISENVNVDEEDIIYVKNLGEKIKDGNTQKEIFANSWIYNTSTRHQILNSNYVLSSTIEESSLKVGDEVEILNRGTEDVVSNLGVVIKEINFEDNRVVLDNGPQLELGKFYDLRRKINKFSSTPNSAPAEFGNNKILSDVLNLYTDNEEYAYVASNSLPSEVKADIATQYEYSVEAEFKSIQVSSFALDANTGFYTSFIASSNVPFLTGDRVDYSPVGDALVGLDTGSYYVEILSNPKSFKLFNSISAVGTSSYESFQIPNSGIGTHNFTWYPQRSGEISPQKLLRKFPLEKNIEFGDGKATSPGPVGTLINGVEISNYKSNDKVYYGPLSSLQVLNSGEGYDVINPPIITSPTTSGTAAKIQPVVSGGIEKVYVDSQDFDIDKIVSINISGGNGSGASLEPVLVKKSRDVLFNAASFKNGGGINTTTNMIIFSSDHNFVNGEEIIYNSTGNSEILIGTGTSSLSNFGAYFVDVINNTTIRIFNSVSDQLEGSNPVGLFSGSTGIQKFSTSKLKKTISYVEVLNSGEGYTNRKLPLNSAGISVQNNLFEFENHGFKDGELVTYDYETSTINGLDKNNQYYILTSSKDNFRLCDAGVGGTNRSNYDRKNYVTFTDTGSGYQYFNYPNVSVSIDFTTVGIGTDTQVRTITTTPVIKGGIIDLYLYEAGTDYGSTVLNYELKPILNIENGKLAELTPVINDGKLISVNINYGGIEYHSIPELTLNDSSGSGSGAELRANISNGSISSVEVISSGMGYSSIDSSILVKSAGTNALLRSSVRELTVDDSKDRFSNGESFLNGKYSVINYFSNLRDSFREDAIKKSGIIGWAFDGHPIYGPFGSEDPTNLESDPKRMTSGYVLDTTLVSNRPVGFSSGFFVEDYTFKGGKDLDEHNGRFEKTKEFPNGTYVYHATLDSLNNPEFPYFIGNSYNSKSHLNESLNQNFDFNQTNLLRNTLPYKISEKGANYDYVPQSNDNVDQSAKIESLITGSIDSLSINNSGENYKVGDIINFTSNGVGSGLLVSVNEVEGKKLEKIETNSVQYTNNVFEWVDKNTTRIYVLPQHDFNNSDTVKISGFSTNLNYLNGSFGIEVKSPTNAVALSTVKTSTATTEIYVSPIPNDIAIGSSIGIGTETLSVLGVFPNDNILRVERGLVGSTHPVGTAITFFPDNFTITTPDSDKFDSKINKKIFFNPSESVGFGTISGISTSVTFDFGNTIITRDLPARSIYYNQHPFEHNQKVVYNQGSIGLKVSIDGDANNAQTLQDGGNFFIVNKGPHLIGIKTTLNSSELYFTGYVGLTKPNEDKYSLETVNTQILGDFEFNTATVSVSTSHGISNGDVVSLDVRPNLTVGIGTSTSVNLIYNSNIDKILVNPIEFGSSAVNTNTDTITIVNHGLNTKDRVLYEDSTNAAVNNKLFYVFTVNRDEIKLTETILDGQTTPPVIFDLTSSGGSNQKLSLVNPPIPMIKNNDLKFDLTDASLSQYKLKIYSDQNFENEFVSTGNTSIFSVNDITGILKYDTTIPERLYYSLEKDGVIIKSDDEVENYSSINVVESEYNNTYKVFGVVGIASTIFKVNLNDKPEKLSYTAVECDTLKYFTKSKTAIGGVSELNIISSGFGYESLPFLSPIQTSSGQGLEVTPKSKTIGDINEIEIVNDNYLYTSDPTLRPQAAISPNIVLFNSNEVGTVSVTNSGEGYTTPPLLTIINSDTREEIDDGLLLPIINGSSVSNVDVEIPPKGLPSKIEIFAVNNSNGISIVNVESSNSGIFTCEITTPTINGISTFTTQPFNDGDLVFVEGIKKFGTDGDGFNSSDYGYKFFKVFNPNGPSYIKNQSVNDKVVLSATEFTTNTGIAITVQDSTATIINKSDYPSFTSTLVSSEFIDGEQLVTSNGLSDLFVVESNDTLLKVRGSYELSINESIKGSSSGTKATIFSISNNSAIFNVNYSNTKDIGWSNQIGKLSEDFQVIEDNDYYQNLSYSVKSSITYEKQKSPIQNLTHVSGLKNFADVGITSASKTSSIESSNSMTVIKDIIPEEVRVDTIYNFDLARDEGTNELSKFIVLQNKKLTNYIELIGNEVLKIDDISSQFSNFESANTTFTNIEEITSSDSYNRYLFRLESVDQSQLQLSEVTVLVNSEDSSIIENESIVNIGSGEYTEENSYGSFELFTNEINETFLRFIPKNAFDIDYNIKVIKQRFNSNAIGSGNTTVGFINLESSVDLESTGIGSTTIFSAIADNFKSAMINAEVKDNLTGEINFVKLYATHNDTDSFLSDYYSDLDDQTISVGSQIGTFYSDLSNGVFSIYHDNNTSNSITIRSNTVGFGTTTVTGISSTFRFILEGQIPGNERSAIYQSEFSTTTGGSSTNILSVDKVLFNASRSIVEVSIGSTKALHQVSVINDGTNVYTQQSPFLSAGSTDILDDASGIGTFGAEISGSNCILKFHPDSGQNDDIEISTLSKIFYSDLDVLNTYPDNNYGASNEKIFNIFYNSINGTRINRTNFELTTNSTPIFEKVFDPSKTSIVSSGGTFTIPNHFFRTGEELTYTPNSTFIGVSASPMTMNAVDDVPSTVYAIKIDDSNFKIATSLSDANSGIGTTIASRGSGNAHRFTANKQNPKSVIAIDGLVQYPLTQTKLSYSVDNYGSIGASSTVFALSGISTINPTDILKIDDEYMKVVNVGLGTTNIGPITNTGTENLVVVERGFVGSSANTHTNNSTVDLFKGGFNIVGNTIHFTEPPRGNPLIEKTEFNTDFQTSDFTGRVFLRSDYSTNRIYDDISDEFTGIGRTFTLKSNKSDVLGIGTIGGSGFVFVNNIFQSPTTENNSNNNYSIIEHESSPNVGVTTIIFSGIRNPDTPFNIIESISDVNQNETPRGGIIVSLGSTPGLGFAPLVGASVTAVINGSGQITGINTDFTGGTHGSGYNNIVSIGVSAYDPTGTGSGAVISAAPVGLGGTLTFTIDQQGSNYSNETEIFVSYPSYQNLPVTGVSRLSDGATTDCGSGLLVDLEIGASTGIGSTLREVVEFKIARQGYGFRRGDVIKPVGLVTDKSLSAPLSEFELTVLDVYSDNFCAWEIGNLDYIDSVKNFQNGTRKRFPLFYNNELLSFEPEEGSSIETKLDDLLIIFINGVLQDPGVSYVFNGGTSFLFTTAPKVEDDVAIYFYRGTNSDSQIVNDVVPSIERGDNVRLVRDSSTNQDLRTVYDLSFSDKFETNAYFGPNIDIDNDRPLTWIKQKRGQKINGEIVYKSRDSLETLISPVSRVIKDISISDNEIFVDNAELFAYDLNLPTDDFSGFVVNGISTTAVDSVESISNFSIVEGFSGIVTGITTAVGTGSNPLALEFSIHHVGSSDKVAKTNFAGITTGYPIYVYNTNIGSGVTSIDNSDTAVVGVGTTFLDNVYYISDYSITDTIGIITCNVKSDSGIVGLGTTGSIENPVGTYSWGKLSSIGNLSRSNPISIDVSGNTVSGLSTYPTIQRRSVGIRNTGALPKIIIP